MALRSKSHLYRTGFWRWRFVGIEEWIKDAGWARALWSTLWCGRRLVGTSASFKIVKTACRAWRNTTTYAITYEQYERYSWIRKSRKFPWLRALRR